MFFTNNSFYFSNLLFFEANCLVIQTKIDFILHQNRNWKDKDGHQKLFKQKLSQSAQFLSTSAA